MIGIFITARLGSTRLSQKHLIQANGKTFIEWLAGRYLFEFRKEIAEQSIAVFITTSVKPENKKFEDIFAGTPVRVFYGPDENIPLRHLECADANSIKYIISVDGDDILCSTGAARLIIDKLTGGANMSGTTGLPLGMNVMGYRTSFLRQSLQQKETAKLETGWGKIFDTSQIAVITLEGYERGGKIRMTLDYPEDAAFFEAVISGVGDKILSITDTQLIDTIIEKDWQQFNADLDEQYWINFNKQKQLEG